MAPDNETRFVITPKNDRSVTITIRLDKDICTSIEEVCERTGRSRNELINNALRFAMEHVQVLADGENEPATAQG